MKAIIDLSHHQAPEKINYDKLAKQVDLVIIRTQYGSKLVDRHYKTHHAEFKKRGVPTAAYAWVRGVSEKDMEVEATDFYNRTKDLNPTFWFLDVEEESMKDMRGGVKAYVKKLRSLGAKKVGVYIAHHLYDKFNLDMGDFDAVWIPRYGMNTGKLHATKPAFTCDLWQYTSVGRLDGYSGDLDLNVVVSDKKIEYFTGVVEQPKQPVKPNTSAAIVPYPGVLFKVKTPYMRGKDVERIQRALNIAIGFELLKVDGIYGPKTAAAVRDYQRRHSLRVDGIVGKNTWNVMF